MKKQLLNGEWHYSVSGGNPQKICVPFSALPVGYSCCERLFDTEDKGEQVFLQLDGITYHAVVTLNGVRLGEMLPYSEYRFDVTDIIMPKGNQLVVELEDISPAFGPTEGWENFGGIIRDVYLVYAEKYYIEDVFFYSELTNDYTNADCFVEVRANGEISLEYDVTLSLEGEAVLAYTATTGEGCTPRRVDGVKLWSPDYPVLYQLKVDLKYEGIVTDTYVCNVGFREIRCDRHRFLLNGKPLFLKGVCKHEMFGDSGHTVTYEQMEQDMLMIKSTGCNFVRLVHYPHNKKILDIADRIGLMVSEEPGLWWSDTANPQVAEGSLEVLRRTIIRDRNHVSIAFWLCFNECVFTEQFLVDSARVCRENDPTRLVSGANCMSDEDTLKYYNICGFDFYTMHPYAPTFERAMNSAKILCDKPLLFTEWGGFDVYNNPNLLTRFMREMSKLYHGNSDEGALAGAFLWCWAEVNDFNRGGPACGDGVLLEGLVDKYRNKRMNYDYFCDALGRFDDWDDESYSYEGCEVIDKTPLAFSGDCDACLCAESVVPTQFNNMRKPIIKNGPVLMGDIMQGLQHTPALAGDGADCCYTGSGYSDCITLVGAVSLGKGYPISGEYGEEGFEIIVEGRDGYEQRFVLRNGVDFTTVFALLGSSRINPQAKNVSRFANFSYDKDFESYVINRLDLKLNKKIEIKNVRIVSLNKGYQLLTYGVLI